MNATHFELLSRIKNQSLQTGREFILTSGEKSNYYLDMRASSMSGEAARLIGDVVYQELAGMEFEAIGGKAVGAVPIVTSSVIAFANRQIHVEGFFVRQETRKHGTGARIEGNLKKGDRAVVIDDVCTTGGSTLEAIKAVEDAGAKVVMVMSIVDRLQGGSEMLREHYKYLSVFTKDDLCV